MNRDNMACASFISIRPVGDFLEAHGHVPLPPYINREDTAADAVEYQTIYAAAAGAVAAPTAGLHFTNSMFESLRTKESKS